ncbi:MAG: CBS domain-containing protein [Saprospiraceae bacterium]|jgi:acetoin utilization protein AcuB|nr:CBS domain-containing protein [Candidatus Defluviibacterium haderslevense]MBK7245288.1 CBS domain-containing protein [Candidatus Defluviibacterium haderslevense]
MNVKEPISTIMTRNLVTLTPEDDLLEVKNIFQNNAIHHIPVVHFRDLVGLVSKSDFLLYANSISDSSNIEIQEDQKLKFTKVKQIMVTRLGKLEPEDRIEVAIDVFLKNYFHCLPVVKDGELMGLVTPFDILRQL